MTPMTLPLWHDNLDVCENNHGGNPQSVAAFESTPKATRATMRALVLGRIEVMGSLGATCDEVEAFTRWPHQTVSARFSELKRDGEIIPTQSTRPTRLGRQARVFVVKAWALHVANEEVKT